MLSRSAASIAGSPADWVMAPRSSSQQRAVEQIGRPHRHGGAALDQAGLPERLADLRCPAGAGPVHQQGEAVEPPHSPQLPEPGVGVLEPRLDLLEQLSDELDGARRGDRPGEARVQDEPADRQDHLAVHVVLEVMEGLVADPDRLLAPVAGEVGQLRLLGVVGAGDRVDGLELAAALLGEVSQEDEETLHLGGVTEPLERVEREVRVAEPAVAVIPRAAGARVLRKARGRRGEQRARVLVLVELQHERRADHLALVVARHTRPLDPVAPMLDGAREESLGCVLEARLERLAEGQRQVVVTVEQERTAVLDVGERHVRRQPERRAEARVLDVVRRTPRRGHDPTVVVDGAAADDRPRVAFQRADDPQQHRGLEGAVVEDEPRGEVEQLERAVRPREDRAQDVRVLDVAVGDRVGVDTLDRELAALLPVEERPEDEARVGAGPAEPFDRSPRDERRRRAVADDAQRRGHGLGGVIRG